MCMTTKDLENLLHPLDYGMDNMSREIQGDLADRFPPTPPNASLQAPPKDGDQSSTLRSILGGEEISDLLITRF